MSHFTWWRTAGIGALLVIGGLLGVPAAQAQITGFSNGDNWTQNDAGAGMPAMFNGDTLQITSNTNDERHAVWYNDSQNISNFTVNYTYTMTGGSGNDIADGITFCIQNDGRGTSTLGGGGGCLGYCGINPSVALGFNVWHDHVHPGEQLFMNGGVGNYNLTLPVDFYTGDTIQVTLVYDGSTLTVTLVDTNTTDTYSNQYSVDIPGTVDPDMTFMGTAVVGFTGATGGAHALQVLGAFSYTSP